MSKKCVIPGCGKELPSDTKVPVCEYHRAEAADKAKKGVGAAAGVAATAFVFVKNNGGEFVKEQAPKIIEIGAKIIRR